MPKLNASAEIHWRRSNMNTRDPILMKSVEVLKDCRSLNAAAEMNCPMPRSVEKVPIRNEKRCSYSLIYSRLYIPCLRCALMGLSREAGTGGQLAPQLGRCGGAAHQTLDWQYHFFSFLT